MTSLLEAPSETTRTSTTPAQRLRMTMAAVGVAFTWFGTRKTLTPEQKAQAADAFGAEGEFLSAGKKLIDTRHPAYKAVTSVRGRLVSYWRSVTLPYPEPGTRLIRQTDITGFDVHMTSGSAELEESVWQLDEHYAELRSAARDRLGSLFNAADYPESLRGLFAVCWDYPSIEPPPYLQQEGRPPRLPQPGGQLPCGDRAGGVAPRKRPGALPAARAAGLHRLCAGRA